MNDEKRKRKIAMARNGLARAESRASIARQLKNRSELLKSLDVAKYHQNRLNKLLSGELEPPEVRDKDADMRDIDLDCLIASNVATMADKEWDERKSLAVLQVGQEWLVVDPDGIVQGEAFLNEGEAERAARGMLKKLKEDKKMSYNRS